MDCSQAMENKIFLMDQITKVILRITKSMDSGNLLGQTVNITKGNG